MNTQNCRFWALISSLVLLAVVMASWLGFAGSGGSATGHNDGGTRLKKQGAPVAAVTREETRPGTQATPLFTPPAWGKPLFPRANASVGTASLSVLATGRIDSRALPILRQFRKGDRIAIPLSGDEVMEGIIHLAARLDGRDRISGFLTGSSKGTFALSQSADTAGEMAGTVLVTDRSLGYEITTVGGTVTVNKKPLDSMICAGMPRPSRPAANAPKAGASAGPVALVVPTLDSKPTARGVLYLDFDGETVTDPHWNGGREIIAEAAVVNFSPITGAQIYDVWQSVADDYRGFNLTVTTDEARYYAAPAGERARAIITPTQGWYSNFVGGVAVFKGYRGSHAPGAYTDTVPCWVFNNYTTSDMALTVSHEFGHMMNLSHDGAVFGGGSSQTYYPGHDFSLPTSWGALMGAPFDITVTQWSKGEYPNANNPEDDFAVTIGTIAEAGFVPGAEPDDIGNTRATAASLGVTGAINQTGIISSSTDVDFYKFSTVGGAFTINLSANSVDPDLDSVLTLYDNLGAVVAVSPVQASSLNSSIAKPLTIGDYFVAVSSKGRLPKAATSTSVAVIGYTSYGSAGRYTLSGSFVPMPAVPLIITQPAALTTVNQGTKVSLTVSAVAGGGVRYKWYKNGNTMPGKTTSTLSFASIQPDDAASYTVELTSPGGTVTSDPAVVVVHYKPRFSLQPLPAKLTVNSGADVTFTVDANALDDLGSAITYVWKHNGLAMVPPQTSPTLTISAAGWYDGGAYTCVAANALGGTTSLGAVLTVASKPLYVTSPPSVKHLPLGGVGSVTVSVVGTSPLTYQWYTAAGAIVPGANKSTLSWAAIKASAAGEYYLVATNSQGSMASSHVVVDVQDVPKITVNPPPAVSLNSTDILTLSSDATGTGPLAFRWQLNNVDLQNGGAVTGADTKNLRVDPALWTHRGAYRCVVTNSVGSAISKVAVVTVISPPVILVPPAPINVATNATAVLKVVAGGTPPLTYHWWKNGSVIPNATGATLTLAHATAPSTNGQYHVTVTNPQSPNGMAEASTPVAVTVYDLPRFTLQPVKAVAGITTTAHFSAAASGPGTVTFQWQKNSKDIAGQTATNLDLTGLTAADSGTYRCIARNEAGSVPSTAVTLSAITLPSITTHPVAATQYSTRVASLKVTAAGAPTLTYQWAKDDGSGLFVSLPATNASAKTATLSFSPVKDADTGSYRVTVSNGAGSVVSNPALFTATPVPLPVIDDFTPHKSRVSVLVNVSVLPAQLVVYGKNFSFVSRAHFGAVTASFVRVSDTQLVISVPGTLTQPTALMLDDVTGTTSSSALFTPYPAYPGATNTPLPLNDDLINAETVFRSLADGYVLAPPNDNTYASIEISEPSSFGHSIWYHWRPGASGNFRIDTVGSRYEPALRVFSGPPVPVNGYSDLQQIVYNLGGPFNTVPGRNVGVNLHVTKGKDYYIQIESSGYSNTFPSYYYGRTVLSMSRALTLGGPVPVRDGVGSPLESSIGGAVSGDNRVAVAWLPATSLPEGEIITAKADLSIQTTIGTQETFSWTVYDHNQSPMFGLVFESATGRVLSQTADGQTKPTGQVFQPGDIYQIALEVDESRNLWSAELNGISILEDQPLSAAAIDNGFGDVGVAWVPAPGAVTGGKMSYGHFSLAAKPAQAKP